MQFSTIFVTFFAANALAAPSNQFTPRDDAQFDAAVANLQSMAGSWLDSKAAAGCDKVKCVLALAPTAVSCAAAAVMGGVDPIADAGCLISGLNSVANKPASCTGC